MYVECHCGNIGQLTSARGWEADAVTPRKHEQFGYAYDAAWNLSYRTNNTLVQTFGVNSLNELTNGTRTGSMTLAGAVSSAATNVAVQANGNPAVSAELYADNTFARDGVALANGTNVFVTVAEDAAGRSATDVVVTHLPESVSFDYDLRGNLVGDGQKRFFYDDENQLTAVVVSNAWLSEFHYDGLLRRRVRQEYAWASGTAAWVETNRVRYVYDGRLVVQERHYDPRVSATVPQRVISYTRGNDLSGSLQEAGGIGGMLARTDSSANSLLRHALYHADGNGNITMLVSTNGLVLASYHYDPYGNVLSAIGPLAEANLYRFSTKEVHPNSGLVYYLYRYYEPKLQRWVNRDPLDDAEIVEAPSLYVFVDNSPTAYLDLDGKGKIAFFRRALLGFWERCGKDQARREVQRERDVLVQGAGSSKESRNLGQEMWGNKTERHDAHAPGQRPHHQHRNGGRGHIFYGTGLAAAISAKHIVGDNILGETLDFLNPLSDVADVYDLWKDGTDTCIKAGYCANQNCEGM